MCGGEGAEALPARWMEGAKAHVGPGVDAGSSLVSSCGRRVRAGVLVTNCQTHHSHQFHDSRCPCALTLSQALLSALQSSLPSAPPFPGKYADFHFVAKEMEVPERLSDMLSQAEPKWCKGENRI